MLVNSTALEMAQSYDLGIDSVGKVHIVAAEDVYQGSALVSGIRYWYGDEQGFDSATVFTHSSEEYWSQISGLQMELDEHDRVHIVFRLHDMFYTQGSFDGFLVPNILPVQMEVSGAVAAQSLLQSIMVTLRLCTMCIPQLATGPGVFVRLNTRMVLGWCRKLS